MNLPYPTTFDITASVGRHGKNFTKDVVVVQTMLKEAAEDPGAPHLDPGDRDGDCGKNTIRAIQVFQNRFMRTTDSRVDANGRTLRNLKKVTFHDGGQCVARPRTSLELVKVLTSHVGDRYILGAAVPKYNSNWIGAWDCAEFVAWGIYQVSGQHVGCRSRTAPNGKSYMNAYTGWFAQDLPKVATQITVDEAAELVGAIALRSPGSPGHIAVSRGANRTIEAASSSEGVKSKHLKGRPWVSYWKLDFLQYTEMCMMI